MVQKLNNICLATVTTPDFLLGTLVMLRSYLDENQRYDIDFLVIHHGLSQSEQRLLKEAVPRLKLRYPSPDLIYYLDRLASELPSLRNRIGRFYSLEITRLIGYERVLFCDSDLLFRGNIDRLFEDEAELLAAPDASCYRGNERELSSFSEVISSDGNKSELDVKEILPSVFNAGFMLFDGRDFGESLYQALLSELEVKKWEQVKTSHTDQVIFNRYYSDRVSFIDARYNYLLLHHDLIKNASSICVDEAIVWHFNGPTKPWKSYSAKINKKLTGVPEFTRTAWRTKLENIREYMHLEGHVFIKNT